MKTKVFLAVAWVLVFSSLAAWPADPIGTVVAIQGTVKAVNAAGAERALEMKAPIFLQDRIETGPASKVQVMFLDDTLFSMGESSAAVIDEYIYNPANKEENGLVVRILKGIARMVTGGITDLNPDRFKVKTGRASIGIRGCDVGFQIGPELDEVYIVRVPQGRSIQVRPMRGGQAGAFRNIVESGVLIRIWEDGRMDQLTLTPDLLLHLSAATTPGPEALLRQRPAADTAVARLPDRDGRDDLKPIVPPPERPLATAPAVQHQLVTLDTALRDPTYVAVQDASLEEHELVEPAAATDSSGDRTPTATPVIDEQPPVAPLPTPVPTPILRLSGGGVGAVYDSSTPAGLTDLYLYRAERGVIGSYRSSVNFSGRHLDAAGNVIEPYPLNLKDIPLLRFGGSTRYEGYRVNNSVPGIVIANDNLQQFVRHIDRTHPETRMTWWGYESSGFIGSKLPSRAVVSYDATLVRYPRVIDPAATTVPYQEINQSDLKVNTRTGAYAVQLADGRTVYGKAGDLTFYGQESQGVGGRHYNSSAQGAAPVVLGVAGFKDNVATRPAESGGWTYRGYAIGTTVAPGSVPGPAHSYSSADTLSDSASANEGRVTVALDKEATGFDNVSVGLRVHQDPALPTTADLTFGQPDKSFYVEGDDALAVYNQPGRDVELQIQGKGQDWTWGEWNGETEVDTGSVPEDRETHGELVAGRTLDPSDFQALVAGGASYYLHTPSTRPGTASGLYTFGSEAIQLAGTANLNVSIPGGGAIPTWSGAFNLQNSAGDSLSMTVPTTAITPNGHLQGNPGFYQLDVDGRSYNQTQITGGGMSGSLVGPGRGPVPVTGAIGEGSFTHNDGSGMNVVYGTDLQ